MAASAGGAIAAPAVAPCLLGLRNLSRDDWRGLAGGLCLLPGWVPAEVEPPPAGTHYGSTVLHASKGLHCNSSSSLWLHTWKHHVQVHAPAQCRLVQEDILLPVVVQGGQQMHQCTCGTGRVLSCQV